jgi:Leucine-rich repeat (LRR) protein
MAKISLFNFRNREPKENNYGEDLSKYFKKNPQRYEVCYNYFDDFKICGVYFLEGTNKNKQQLIIEAKEDLIRGDTSYEPLKIKCIHTALCEIEELPADREELEQLEAKVQEIRSSEILNPKEFKISPEESFKAFKSWIAGIAEAGYKGIEIQSEIEAQAKFIIPISSRILYFLSKYKEDLFYNFVRLISKKSMFEGVRAEAYILINALNLLKTYRGNYSKILFILEELDPKLKEFSIHYHDNEFSLPNNKTYYKEVVNNILRKETLNILTIKDNIFSEYNFEKLPNLVRINLYGNRKLNLSTRSLRNLNKLEELNLYKLNLYDSNIFIDFKHINNIKALRIGDGGNLIIKNLDYAKKIKSISISNMNNIKNLNKIFNIETLKELWLEYINDNNFNINKLNPNLPNLGSLELNSISSGFHNIPDWIYNLKTLYNLTLHNNEIRIIEPKISNLQNLFFLNLSRNKFKELPESISELKELIHLDLSSNHYLEKLPKSLKKLKKLSSIYITDCPLLKIPIYLRRKIFRDKSIKEIILN